MRARVTYNGKCAYPCVTTRWKQQFAAAMLAWGRLAPSFRNLGILADSWRFRRDRFRFYAIIRSCNLCWQMTAICARSNLWNRPFLLFLPSALPLSSSSSTFDPSRFVPPSLLSSRSIRFTRMQKSAKHPEETSDSWSDAVNVSLFVVENYSFPQLCIMYCTIVSYMHPIISYRRAGSTTDKDRFLERKDQIDKQFEDMTDVIQYTAAMQKSDRTVRIELITSPSYLINWHSFHEFCSCGN